jgi:hypothetical protein
MNGVFTPAHPHLFDTAYLSISVVKNSSKNEGPSHDVIENTGPCLGIRVLPHDVYENTRFIVKCHDVPEK